MITLKLQNDEIRVYVRESGEIWYAEAWCPALNHWFECIEAVKNRPPLMDQIYSHMEIYFAERFMKEKLGVAI